MSRRSGAAKRTPINRRKAKALKRATPRARPKLASRDAEYRRALGISEDEKLPGYERAEPPAERRRGPGSTRIKLTVREQRKKKFSDLYVVYMASAQWQEKRALYFSAFGRTCKAGACRKPASDVHHHTYIRFTQEELTDLVGLCRFHHDAVHELHRRGGRLDLTRATEKITGLRLKN